LQDGVLQDSVAVSARGQAEPGAEVPAQTILRRALKL